MDHPTTNIISLFSGIGGLDLGVSAALGLFGIEARTVCYVEGGAFQCACLAAQMEAGALDAAPVWSDIRTFDARPWRGLVDGVVGGFPCQDLSSAGQRRGIRGRRSGLFYELARIVRELEPRWIFLENVEGIYSRGLPEVLAELAEIGLDAQWGRLSAAAIGAPHERRRWFCLAYPKVADGDRRGLQVKRKPKPRGKQGARGRKPHRRGALQGELYPATVGYGHRTGPPLDPDVGVYAGEKFPPLERAGRSLRLHPWPPGPDEHEAWERYAGPKPAVRGGDDGLSCRVDRLFALGNAVVPEQAKAAFTELWLRAGEDE